MQRLDNPIKNYAWGDLESIPRLLGREPNGQPHAELWLGAHPSDPSKLAESGEPLSAFVSKKPEAALGDESVQRFGPVLPFLLKVLAAGKPLSLQAHPSLAQAKAGFARESLNGPTLQAASRNYKDANHKPELICALTEFHALCGFRRVADSVTLLRALGLPVQTLETQGLKAYFSEVMTAQKAVQQRLASQAAKALASLEGHALQKKWGLALAEQYPGDAGLIGALLLNVVTLQPGQALYLPAGNLHAYLHGTGIELMANSDNVLRGGLTPKHVDANELLSVLDFADGPIEVMAPSGAPHAVYSTPAADFELSRIEVRGVAVPINDRRGADLLLVTHGKATVSSAAQSVELARGESVFAAAADGPLTLFGEGDLYRATVGRI